MNRRRPMDRREAERIQKRIAKRAAQDRKDAELVRRSLIRLLDKYVNQHYADPATGRQATVCTAPVMARLAAAASLHALLQADENVEKKPTK
jgi:hypothetical protein